MYKAILFDLDGTIIDSEALAFKVLKDWGQRHGVPIQDVDADAIAGKKWQLAFDHVADKFSLPVPKHQMAREILGLYHEALADGGIIPVPGVVAAIKALAPHTKLALVSGSFRKDIIFALETLGLWEDFRVVLGAEDYLNSKPAPDGYLKAMEMLEVAPEESLVFEDSYPGILSGRGAGAKVVAVTSTNHFQQKQDLAHAAIKDFLQVTPAWVRELHGKLLSTD